MVRVPCQPGGSECECPSCAGLEVAQGGSEGGKEGGVEGGFGFCAEDERGREGDVEGEGDGGGGVEV